MIDYRLRSIKKYESYLSYFKENPIELNKKNQIIDCLNMI